MEQGETGPEFPRLLRRAWTLTDAQSRSMDHNDALDAPTEHQTIVTHDGSYRVCSQTGQMFRVRGASEGYLEEEYERSWKRRIELGSTGSDKRAAGHRRWLGRLARYRKTGRLFEVGAGLGGFLKAAAEAGWRAEGNELSQTATEFANRTDGVRVAAGPMERVELEEGAYDVVLCNNVFEHLSEPGRVLIGLARSLRAGGVIYFQTLNAQSWSLWVDPRGWHYFSSGHLFVPTLVSFRHYFRRAGLEVVRSETHGFRCGSAAGGGRMKRRWWERLGAVGASLCGRGHRVKCVLRKPVM